MRLALTNIREHEQLELTLPPRGLVQLSGESGTGKTSVLEGVAFALFDNRRGVRARHQRSCAAALTGFGLDVWRRRAPNALRVNGCDGEAAQGLIERHLGMGATEFMASSYIVQDLHSSLLTLPPAEQQALVQKLACGQEDPERMQLALKRRIRELELTLAAGEGQMRVASLTLKEREAYLEKLPRPDPAGLADAGAPARHAVTAAALARCREDEDGVRRELMAVTKALVLPRDHAQAPREDLTCPSCRARVVLAHGRLVFAATPSPAQEAAEGASLSGASAKSPGDTALQTTAKRKGGGAEGFLKNHLRFSALPLLRGRLASTIRMDRDMADEPLSGLAPGRPVLAAAAGAPPSEGQLGEGQWTLLHRQESLAAALETAGARRRAAEAEADAEGLALARHREASAMAKRRDDEQGAIQSARETQEQAALALAKTQTDLAAARRLKELSDQAATEATWAILDTINLNAAYYLEALFPGAETTAQLRGERTLGSGETRVGLALEIAHKGRRGEPLGALSGGERSRLVLAFQLALSAIFRSPFLMIDEGMKGLSPALKELTLELLRELSAEKLVIVVEHGAPSGYFDEIIELGPQAPRERRLRRG